MRCLWLHLLGYHGQLLAKVALGRTAAAGNGSTSGRAGCIGGALWVAANQRKAGKKTGDGQKLEHSISPTDVDLKIILGVVG